MYSCSLRNNTIVKMTPSQDDISNTLWEICRFKKKHWNYAITLQCAAQKTFRLNGFQERATQANERISYLWNRLKVILLCFIIHYISCTYFYCIQRYFIIIILQVRKYPTFRIFKLCIKQHKAVSRLHCTCRYVQLTCQCSYKYCTDNLIV